MLRPEASGKRPRIVVMAVNKTGLSLVLPPSITEALKSSLETKVASSRLSSSLFLLLIRLV